jgi:nucleotide-binding universal stress UspA family protein
MTVRNRILVATDLSAHSDRALDRAVSLARETDAHLIVLHVLERHAGPARSKRAAMIERQLACDLGAAAERASIRIEEGHPARVIERVAREEQCRVVIVGVTRTERFGHWSVSKTVDRLLRRAPAPLLVVSDRPRGPYRNVAVAVDFSKMSAATTTLTAALFPGQPITVFHAYEPLTYGIAGTSTHPAHFVERGHATYEDWLSASKIPSAVRKRLDVEIQVGEPTSIFSRAARQGSFDVLVLGTRGHGRLFELLLGSVAKRILVELPCDALFVRPRHLYSVQQTSRVTGARVLAH